MPEEKSPIIKKTKRKSTSHANRGMKFEEKIIKQCGEYERVGKAYIYKLPTEFKIVRGAGGKIVSAFPVSKSKLDFYGTLPDGMALHIEAKSASGTSLPFSNISDHQIDYMRYLSLITPYVFLLVEMKKYNEVYLINSKEALHYIDHADRKSFPYDWLQKHGTLLEGVDFLPVILT